MLLPSNQLEVAPAVCLGIAVHLLLHIFEPSDALTALTIITLGPVILFVPSFQSACCIATTYAVYLSSLSLSVFLYRISPFHPLAGIPGPFWLKVSKISGMWISFTGKTHIVVKDLHDRYGPVVRTGPNEVSIVDVKAISAVLGASGFPKGSYYSGRGDPSSSGSLLVLRGAHHASRRRIWNRGMGSASLKEYESIVVNRANELVGQLESHRDSASLDLCTWIKYFTFDVMGDMAFGKGFDMMRDGDKVGFWDVLERFFVISTVVCHVPWAVKLAYHIPFVSRNLQGIRKFGADCAYTRIKDGVKTKDLWYHLSDEPGLEKEKPSIKEVAADGALAVVAGSDTTSSALSSLFFFLLCNPTYYKRLQAEVDSTFPTGEDALDTSKHVHMPFLNACVNEALRLHPPVPTSGPRQVPRDSQGSIISDCFIPPGTQIYIPPYSIHRDERYFSPFPDKFLPERWLDPKIRPNQAAFIPFSFGPAGCVGKQFARQEIMMVMSLLIQRLEFSFADGFDQSSWEFNDHYIATREPLRVTIRSRT